MPRHIPYAEAERVVRTRRALLDEGMRERDIARAVDAGRLRRIQRNRYVDSVLWDDLWPESRHLVEVASAVGEMRDGSGVVSYDSAGALWTLPLYRHMPSAVHFSLPVGERMSSRPGARRHSDQLPAADITTRAGVRCTTRERTTFDLARTLPLEAAVAAADAALRQFAWRDGQYDIDAAEDWRQRMLRRCAPSKGTRGIRQAEWVVLFADGRADLPGESVTRLQLTRLGFTRLGVQVPVPGPHGRDYRVDIELEDVGALLEFDGEGKYLDDARRSRKSLQHVLLDEKRREDWIRGTTQKRFVRVEASHIVTREALAARLAAFGIRAPGR